MCKLKVFATVIFVWLVSTPSSAMPFKTFMNADRSVENARWFCNEFGRCWQSPSAPYASRYRYSGYGYGYRPLTKWEWKGFRPPGQRKKGNC